MSIVLVQVMLRSHIGEIFMGVAIDSPRSTSKTFFFFFSVLIWVFQGRFLCGALTVQELADQVGLKCTEIHLPLSPQCHYHQAALVNFKENPD